MTTPSVVQALPSGRSVAVQVVGGEEQLVVRAPDGSVEVQIVLTAAGAVVRVGAARLEVAAEQVAVDCKSFAVRAADGVDIQAGEFRVRTEKSIHLNGETVRLNCADAAVAPAPEPVTDVLPPGR